VFVVNIVLALLFCVAADFSILLSEKATLLVTIVLALLNVALLFNIYFSFVQIHRYLIGKTIARTGNALLGQYVFPAIDSVFAKITTPVLDNTNDSGNQIQKTLLSQIKKEHVSKGIRYLLYFILKRIRFQNLHWNGDKYLLMRLVKEKATFILTGLSAASNRILLLVFGVNWLIVLILFVLWFLNR